MGGYLENLPCLWSQNQSWKAKLGKMGGLVYGSFGDEVQPNSIEGPTQLLYYDCGRWRALEGHALSGDGAWVTRWLGKR